MTSRLWPQAVLTIIMLLLSAQGIQARPHQAIDSTKALDEQIEACLDYLGQGDIAQARLLARQMAWRFPDFALGQLISAELESTAAFNDILLSEHLPIARNVSELLLEARQRLSALQTHPAKPEIDLLSAQQLPGDLIQVGAHLSQLVIVNLDTSILYQYQTSPEQANLVRQHYIGSGEAGFGKRLEGDLKTPLGVYTINGYHTDAALPDLYGAGALTLDYPNALDQYLGRTGYGIWLHGVPSNQRSRTPYSSEGCVTMSNEHMTRLSHSLDAMGTRVVLTNNVSPLSPAERSSLKQQFQQLFTQYQRAWIDADKTALASLYRDRGELDRLLASGNNGLLQVDSNELNSKEAAARFSHYLYRYAFSNTKSDEISIFRNPDVSDRDSDTATMIVMDTVFGNTGEHQITLYWSQNNAGQWQILTETVKNTGTGL